MIDDPTQPNADSNNGVNEANNDIPAPPPMGDASAAGATPEPEPTASAGSSNEKSTTTEAFEDLKAAAKNAWKSGAEEAKKTAQDAIPGAKDILERTAYEVIYDLAYGAQFTSTLLKSMVPDGVVNANQKGSSAGREAAEDFLRKRKEKNETAQQTPGAPPAEEQTMIV